jgi:sterol desaturase/sphingolipid hydroxylase (fatty acid hydroxylase superfamily)
VADLAQYAIHRLCHVVPFLWRFHAIHHNAQALDWIAGSRSHFVDVVIVRSFILTPLIVLGFAQSVVAAYLIFVTIHATLEHANFAPEPTFLEELVVLPRHHHWHHASHDEAIDKDFAIHFPWIDRLFGTHYSPKGQWPERYGLAHSKLPKSFLGQFFAPFLGKV